MRRPYRIIFPCSAHQKSSWIFIQSGLIPKNTQDLELALSEYTTGRTDLIVVISRLKTLLDYETLYWSQFVEREKAIARLHAITEGLASCREVKKNERRNFIAVIGYISFACCILFFLSFIFTTPVLCPGTCRTYMPPPAAVKTEAAKPQAPQPAQQEDMTEETPQVEISPEQQQLIGVKTVKVSLKSLQKVIRTVGRIEADERKLATVNTKIEGWIEKLHVDYTGRYVKKESPGGDLQPGASGDTAGISRHLNGQNNRADKKKDDYAQPYAGQGCRQPHWKRQDSGCGSGIYRMTRSNKSKRRESLYAQ